MTTDQGYSSPCYSLDFSKVPTGTYTSSATYGSLSDTQRKWIKYTLMFGKTVKNMQYNSTYCYTATQLLIWNIVYGSFTATAKQSDSETYMLASTHDPNIKGIYSEIRTEILSYDSKASTMSAPSFASLVVSATPTQLLYYNPADHLFEATLTDSNNALSDYPFASTAVLVMDHSISNQLSLSTGSVINSPQTLSAAYTGVTNILNTAVEGEPVYWVNDVAQPFVSLDTTAPRFAYFNVQTAPAHTAVTLTSDSAKSSYGDPVRFTASLDHPLGSGTITFQDGTTGNTLCTVNTDGRYRDETAVSFDCPSLVAGNHSITATYSGVENYYESKTSDPLSHEIVAQTVSPTLAASGITSKVGDPVTFSLQGLPADAGGTVTFLCDGVQIGDVVTVIPGSDVLLTTSVLTPGDHTITAQYKGDAKYAPTTTAKGLAHTVEYNTVTLSIRSGTQRSNVGDSVTFSLQGLPSDAGGTVTFLCDNVQIGDAVTVTPGHDVSITTSALTAGEHEISATYSGDAKYASATTGKVLTHTVLYNTGVLSVNCGNQTSNLGDSVTFSLQGLPSDAGGTVTFLCDNVQMGDTIMVTPGHDVSITTSALTVGEHEFSATYSGDVKYALATTGKALVHTVEHNMVTLSVRSSTQTSDVSDSVTFSMQGLPADAGGTVTFLCDSVQIGNAITVIPGHDVSITTSALTAGEHEISATYSGDAKYASATTGKVLTHTILYNTGVLSVNCGNQTSDLGDSVTFSLQGLPVDAGGTVTFFCDNVQISEKITVKPGIAPAFSTASLAKGDHLISAEYSGDTKYASATTGQVLIHTIEHSMVTLSVSSSTQTSYVGDSVTFSLQGLPADAGGTVTFFCDNVQISDKIMVTPGIAPAFSTASLAKGDHLISAEYSGDTKYASATTGQVLIHTIEHNAITLSVSSSTQTSNLGDSVTFSLQGLPVDAGGTVAFFCDGVQMGDAVAVTSGTAPVFSTAAFAIGEHTITAQYSGDAKYAGAKAELQHTVTKIPVSMILTVGSAQGYLNEPVTLSVSGLPKSAVGEHVVFQDGNTVIGTGVIDANGNASATVTSLTGGNHQLTAYYPGNDRYATAHSNVFSINIYVRIPEQPVIPIADAGNIAANENNSADSGQTVTIPESIGVPLTSNPKTGGKDFPLPLYATLGSISILIAAIIKKKIKQP